MSVPRFGVTHPVPANLLMMALLLAGAYCAATLTREFFPESSAESATVRLPYPGATPEEIEESMAKKVEDKLADLEKVEQITTVLSEGSGSIIVEYRDGADATKATDDVERAIDTLTDLPDEAEEIQVAEFEPQLPVIMVTLFGESDEESLKRAIRAIRDDLQSLPDMGEMILSGVRDYEIRVDVGYAALLEHGLSLPQVSQAIRDWMTDVPGGTVQSEAGNVNVRALGIAERATAIRDIVIKADREGGSVRVADVAEVRETFVDQQIRTRFADRERSGPSASLTVYKVGDQDSVEIAEMVREYVRGRRAAAGDPDAAFEPRLPDRLLGLLGRPGEEPPRTKRFRAYELGLNAEVPLPNDAWIATSSDLARFIEGRLDLLVRNAKYGAILVFATLLLFLNWRTAWWVGVGLTTALAGTLLFMAVAGVTLNLLTMFGLIIVLGLLVDDAIVVAENITARHDRNEPALVAAISGTEQVFWPVVATILTSIVAFLPLTFVKGQIGDLLGALPWVVACALVMSLIESVFILPSHMAHSLVHRDHQAADRQPSFFQRLERRRDSLIMDRLVPAYGRLLALAIRYRYVCVSLGLSIFVASAGMLAGGRLEFEFLPQSDSETVIVALEMPIGTALADTERIVERIEATARAQPETKSISTLVGVQAAVDDTSGVTSAGQGTHLGQLFIELVPVEERDRESSSVIAAIREQLGPVDGAESLGFSEIQGGPGGKDLTVRVTGNDDVAMAGAVDAVKAAMRSLDGVYDIADDRADGQREVQISLRPGAAALGFTVAGVAQQVRAALFGVDAHVFSQSREDIDVRVRLDEQSRRSLRTIESLWVASPTGTHVPLPEIAVLEEGSGFNAIRRVDRRRSVSVTADTAPDVSPETVLPEITKDFDAIEAQFPGVQLELGGRQRQMAKAFSSLPIGFATAMVLIYVILAWLFSSYTQPLAVLLAVPFSMIGVIWGHILMGYPLTFLSLIGFVALGGIVVNDSLILVQFYNERRKAGEALAPALLAAGQARLRPILLTTITTVLGLTPLMLEQSFQAKFLIPMAIAISFGLMSATFLILLLLPALLVIFDDLRRAIRFLWHGGAPPEVIPVGLGAEG